MVESKTTQGLEDGGTRMLGRRAEGNAPSCVITGATGLIGSRLAAALAASWEVTRVSRHAGDVTLDFSRPWDARTLPDRIDAVVHLAQAESYRDFPESAESMFRVNTASTAALLDYARRAGARKLIYASSGGIYGSGDRPFAETDPASVHGALGYYLRTKLASELLAGGYASIFEVIILRFFFVYGAGQKSGMLMPRLIASVASGAPIALQGEDGLRFNPICADDAAGAIAGLLERDAEAGGDPDVINIAGPQVLTLREACTAIGAALSKDPVFEVNPSARPANLIADITKQSGLLGAPPTRFETGIREMIREGGR